MTHFTFIGLDVHKNSVSVAIANQDGTGEACYYGKTGGDLADLEHLIRRLGCRKERLRVVYEAGPCGYGIYRHLQSQAIACTVVAPSMTPRRAGDRVKTDRRPMIAVETVKVPAYLDRNQIVTKLDDTEYRLADFNHWAELLSDTLTRVMAENLSRMLVDQSAQVLPITRSIPFDYRIDVEVLQLDGQMNGHVTLVARWAIFGREVDDLLHLEKSLYREAVSGDAYKDLVSAYSRVIEKLCRDVAQVLEGTISIPSD